MDNLILQTDSYKASHYLQYPPGTEGLFAYGESRGGRYDSTLFFGLQYYLKEYLTRRMTLAMVEEAKAFFDAHGEPFNEAGFRRIAVDLGGRLPVRVRAVPEGMVIPTHNVLFTVESTDPSTFWIVSWLETLLLRVWYPITVATQSFHLRRLLLKSLERTADAPEAEVDFKLHDFGARGVSSSESAAIGGGAHLVNFKGSDTVEGVLFLRRYYDEPMAAFSIPAAEHSTITAWGKAREGEAYANMLRSFGKPGKIFACVSDSYDLWNAVEHLWGGELRQAVIDSGATLVVRPDSGDPESVVLRTLELLDARFGSTRNTKGFRVLNHVKVIQGDGVNHESIAQILEVTEKAGYSTTNLAFGMGGALLQQVHRDTQRFAFKASQIVLRGKPVAVFKDPVTDPQKRSKRGRLDLVREGNTFRTVEASEPLPQSVLQTVFENGELLVDESLTTVRARARSFEKEI